MASNSAGDIMVTIRDGVCTIRMNRPKKKNALLTNMYVAIADALNAAAENDSVRLLVTMGTGDYYTSGNDLTNFTKLRGLAPSVLSKVMRDGNESFRRYVEAFINFPKPLVAVVNGPAVGVGVTSLGLHDFVYAKQSATFNTPFTPLGLRPEACSSFIFPMIMGQAKASEVLLLNRKLTANEAYERNLVTRVFSEEEFDERVEEILKYMSSLPPQAFRGGKMLMREAFRKELLEVNEREGAAMSGNHENPEILQAVMAFFSKRQPSKL